jgi:hypothetical protein
MILMALPTEASAPDVDTYVANVEGETPDESSCQHVRMLRWKPHHRNRMLRADNPLILNYSYQRNRKGPMPLRAVKGHTTTVQATNNFIPLLVSIKNSLATSFGNNDNHTQHQRLHIHIYNGTAVNAGCQDNIFACRFGHTCHRFVSPGLEKVGKPTKLLSQQLVPGLRSEPGTYRINHSVTKKAGRCSDTSPSTLTEVSYKTNKSA